MPKATCSVPSCTKFGQTKRGWCDAHYHRWWLNGDPQEDVPVVRLVPGGQYGPVCTVDGCEKATSHRGWCSMHDTRMRVTGRLDLASPDERLWSYVNKNGPIPDYRPDLGACWLWTGGTIGGGYGRSSYHGSDNAKVAHRVTYELLVGPIPEGLQLDHLCRVRTCVNPSHLEPVTAWENIRRGESPPAKALRQTHCINGHEFTAGNIYVPPKRPNRRECRACRNDRLRHFRNPT